GRNAGFHLAIPTLGAYQLRRILMAGGPWPFQESAASAPGRIVAAEGPLLGATLRSSTIFVRHVTNATIRYNGTFGNFRIYRKLGNDACAGGDTLRAGWKDK